MRRMVDMTNKTSDELAEEAEMERKRGEESEEKAGELDNASEKTREAEEAQSQAEKGDT